MNRMKPVLLLVTYTAKPGMRENFLQEVEENRILEAIRGEDGCISYDYFLAAEAPDDLLLVESWTTPALQQAHCQTEIFGKLQALKAEFCDSVHIDKFDH